MPGPSSLAASGVFMIAEVVVIALVVFTVLFALAVIWVAFWYHTHQDKQVRLDEPDAGDGFGFQERPGEEEQEEQEEAGDEEGERLEPGTRRFRRT